ncbi:hypothetical protein HQ535_16880 [bacterium]|nr:hypothetical protein [bacterium]
MLVEKDDVLRRSMACRAFAAPEVSSAEMPAVVEADSVDGEGDADPA